MWKAVQLVAIILASSVVASATQWSGIPAGISNLHNIVQDLEVSLCERMGAIFGHSHSCGWRSQESSPPLSAFELEQELKVAHKRIEQLRQKLMKGQAATHRINRTLRSEKVANEDLKRQLKLVLDGQQRTRKEHSANALLHNMFLLANIATLLVLLPSVINRCHKKGLIEEPLQHLLAQTELSSKESEGNKAGVGSHVTVKEEASQQWTSRLPEHVDLMHGQDSDDESWSCIQMDGNSSAEDDIHSLYASSWVDGVGSQVHSVIGENNFGDLQTGAPTDDASQTMHPAHAPIVVALQAEHSPMCQ